MEPRAWARSRGGRKERVSAKPGASSYRLGSGGNASSRDRRDSVRQEENGEFKTGRKSRTEAMVNRLKAAEDREKDATTEGTVCVGIADSGENSSGEGTGASSLLAEEQE